FSSPPLPAVERNCDRAVRRLSELPRTEEPDHDLFVVPVTRNRTGPVEKLFPRLNKARTPHPDKIGGKSESPGKMIKDPGAAAVHPVFFTLVKDESVTVAQQQNGAPRVLLNCSSLPGGD